MAISVDTSRTVIRVTGTTDADASIYTGLLKVKYIYWFQPATAGMLLTLKDGNGAYIIELRCETDNESQLWPLFNSFDGIRTDDMDGGTLYIYR